MLDHSSLSNLEASSHSSDRLRLRKRISHSQVVKLAAVLQILGDEFDSAIPTEALLVKFLSDPAATAAVGCFSHHLQCRFPRPDVPVP